MLQHLPEAIRHRIGNTALALLGLGVFLAMWGTLVRVQQSMDSGREDVRRAGLAIVEAVDHDLDVHVSHLRAMAYLAQRFLAGRTLGAENPITRLVLAPGREGYESVLPPSFGDLTQLGRITGGGPVPALDDPVAQEMAMAVGLTPIMRAVKERSADVPWVHYASARRFMFIFPHKGSEAFHFTPALMQRSYFAQATPSANPQRGLVWSEPYEDAAGQGQIVTASQPIDHEGVFLGSVSIDVKVQSLRRHLEAVPIAKTHVHVVRTADGQRVAQAWPHTDDADVRPHDRILLPLKTAPWSLELRIDEGELLKAALRGRMWHISAVAVMVVSFVFLLLLTRSHRHVRALAISDGLTGLYNRRFFDRVARHQFAVAQRNHGLLGLALLDIDFFKKYNDHYGHQQGDVALKAVAQAIQHTLRRSTDQVFRVGGEEFAVLLNLKQADEFAPLLQQINQAVRDLQLPHAGNPPGHATISIGGVVVDQAGENVAVEAAYKRADEALYEAKSSGRDRTVCR